MGGCPFHGGDDSGTADDDDRTGAASEATPAHGWDPAGRLGRRAFVRSAVAIGGANALAALAGGTSGRDLALDAPAGDPATRPARQHEWAPAGRTDAHGNPVPPRHQVVLLLDYVGDDPDGDAEAVEAAFRCLERAFAYDQTEGLLLTVGYSPAYFRRRRGGRPAGVDITEPRPVSPHADPVLDRQDVFVQLASDDPAVVLAAEQALRGDLDAVNGVDVSGSLAGVFEVDDRRAVFAGRGLPADRIDADEVPADAPLSMGFKSAFADSIPPAAAVAIDRGPWRDGTVAQVSLLGLDLADWYDRDESERVSEMFAPAYDPADVGDAGDALGEGSGRADGEGWSADLSARTLTDARERGVVGHAQKVARARDEEFSVRLLRRDGNVTTADGDGGLSFVGLVAGISDWFEVAEAMYDTRVDGALRGHDRAANGDGGDPAAGGHHPRSGIAAQVTPLRRGHFLVPPRSLRALPPAEPGR